MPFRTFGFGSGLGRQPAAFPPLTPEEEDSLLSRIMGSALGGLQFFAETLDKPGAAVRGVLAGKPEALANLIPFSDTLGITDPADRVYGSDILVDWGLRERNDPDKWFEPGDFAGFGFDVLTDPLSFVNPLGGLTKGGHVAQRAGILDDLSGLVKRKRLDAGLIDGAPLPGTRQMRSANTLDELIDFAKQRAPDDFARQEIDNAVSAAAEKFGYSLGEIGNQRLGGSIGFSAGPFGHSVAPGGPVGEIGRYGKAFDAIGQVASGSGLGRGLQSLFSRRVLGQTDPLAQQELKLLDRDKQLIASESARDLFRLRDDLHKVLGDSAADDSMNDALRAYAEYGDNYKNAEVVGRGFENLPEIPDAAKGIVNQIKERKDSLYERLVDTGLVDRNTLESRFGTEHFYRRASGRLANEPVVGHEYRSGNRAFETRSDVLSKREVPDMPGGTVRANRILQDPRLARGTDEFAGEVTRQRIIAEEAFGLNGQQFRNGQELEEAIERFRQNPNQQGAIDPELLNDTQKSILDRYQQSKEVAKWAAKHNVREKPLFGRHILEDDRTYSVSVRGATATADAIHEMFAQGAKSFDEIPPAQAGNYVLLENAYSQAGFKGTDTALQNFLSRTGGKFGRTADEIAQGIYVPKSVVDAATDVLKKFESPREVNAFLKWVDSATNLFKLGATARLAFHVRNRISGLVQNVLSGAYRFDQVPKYQRIGKQFTGGKTIEGLSKHEGIKRLFGSVSDEKATKQLAELVEVYDLRGSRFDEVLEGVDEVPEQLGAWERLTHSFPEQAPLSIPQMGKNLIEGVRAEPGLKAKIGSVINPKRVAGIGEGVTAATETNVLSKLQREAGRYTEDINRVGAFLGYLDNGYSPAAAAQRVKATHVDYKNLSNFDREYMRRVFPFWSFFKGISVNTAEEIVSHPGGKLAQTIRASNRGREGGGYVPDYIGEGLSIPIGDDKYIARLGLMHESPFEAFAFRTKPRDEPGEPSRLDAFGTLGRTFQKIGSMGTPYAKLPVELATDKQLFTGRSFKDLYPYPIPTDSNLVGTDISLLLNAALGDSPVGSQLATARKLADERKSPLERVVSTASGIGLTDVYGGAERAKQLDAARRAKEIMEGSPRIREYSTLYAPKDVREQLTPTERALLRFQATDRERRKEAALK